MILDKTLYDKSIFDMLLDSNTYCKLAHNPSKEMSSALDHLLGNIQSGVKDNKQREYFLVKNPICPIFHAFSRTHKNYFPPPFRLLIAGIGSLIERMCSWLDDLLQPLVIRAPDYVKILRSYSRPCMTLSGNRIVHV